MTNILKRIVINQTLNQYIYQSFDSTNNRKYLYDEEFSNWKQGGRIRLQIRFYLFQSPGSLRRINFQQIQVY